MKSKIDIQKSSIPPRPYRGMTKDGKELKGWHVEAAGKSYIIPTLYAEIAKDLKNYEVLPKTVGLRTGIKDENGKDLDWWEGDIILAIKGIPHVIVFDNGAFYLEAKDGGRWLANEAAIWPISARKKVGNIHGKPELLKR